MSDLETLRKHRALREAAYFELAQPSHKTASTVGRLRALDAEITALDAQIAEQETEQCPS